MAADSLAVLVPVLNRPQNVAPLVESFLAHCPPDSRLDFLVSAYDTAEMDEILVQHVNNIGRVWFWHPVGTSWPKRINYGVAHVDADWYLCAADDITFTEGWWEATEQARGQGYGVIGTNDSATGTGNPAVATQAHTCHPLVARWYVDLGTWDRPGQIACEDYHHWYVDNEIVVTAKYRQAWCYVKEAILEHHHPYWKGVDNVPWDDTYTLGESRANEDKRTWIRRAAQFGVPA
jgi:glycosyltransferase involved in cell wall biosynthesis